MQIIFIVSIIIVLYTYLGYGVLLYIIVLLKRIFIKHQDKQFSFDDLPSCTVIVAAFNEAGFIEDKIKDTLGLSYPLNRLKIVFVTDGSTDETPQIVSRYPQITLLHKDERKGKIAAVHRAMLEASTEVVVFTDANTFLHSESLIQLCKHYADKKVGGVAGEKKIFVDKLADATAGEGFYWKYESKLKSLDSEFYSVVGAAGELYSIRCSLYTPVPIDSILDDFMISMGIAERGYKIKYEPQAYAQETSSANIQEEMKRKIRIAAGAFQSIIWLKSLLNPFKLPILTFQYLSHRVLRWTIAPLALVFVYIANVYLAIINTNDYGFFLFLQSVFYVMAFLGSWMESKKVRLKILFIPYYFCLMNYAVLAGGLRFFFGHQSVMWEKAKRK